VERRLFTFFVAWTALFILFMLTQRLFPQPEPAKQPAKAEPQAIAKVDESPVGEADAAKSEPIPDRPKTPKWLSLGSMDPADGYHLLVTFNSQGAGVQRIEITKVDENNDLKYRRVDVRHGYLGYLAATENEDATGGAKVGVVGAGTPAAIAGVKVDDVIKTINGQGVTDEQSIEDALLKTRPGETTKIDIVRGSESLSLSAKLTEHPLDLIRLSSLDGTDQVEGNLSRLSCLMTFAQVNRQSIAPADDAIFGIANPAQLIWNGTKDSKDSSQSASFELPIGGAELERASGGPMTLRRSYSLAKGTYVVDMDLEIENRSSAEQDVAYRLEGPNGITLEGWWYVNKISPNFMGGAAARDVIYKVNNASYQLASGFDLLKKARDEPDDPSEPIFAAANSAEAPDLSYVGVDAQYFTVAYLPSQGAPTLSNYRRFAGNLHSDVAKIPRHKEKAVNSSFYLDSGSTLIPAGAKHTEKLRMFAGPKEPELLETYGLSETVYYGWFSVFARFLAGILHFFAGIGNYGIAIILLTVLVRGLMFPLSRKAAINAQRMQELAPEMKKIAEQYKDDMQGRLRAQQELQKRSGFNPMAGCLPMFIQLPIFIGLYRALSVDIELRQQPLIPGIEWASNLGGPDMMSYWADWLPDFISGRGTGWLGPYFNLLPMLVMVLFLVQQKMFMPPATDEQTRLTQRMMTVMTLVMGLFFFRVPAGLCVYFITSSLWGIAERILVKKTLPPKKELGDIVLEGGPAKIEKSSSLAQRLKDRIQPPQPTFDAPNKRKRPGRNK
jgi:YidC/Oxa1 family membrane protein insertase